MCNPHGILKPPPSNGDSILIDLDAVESEKIDEWREWFFSLSDSEQHKVREVLRSQLRKDLLSLA
jgi:hypothetical protein